MDPSRIAALLSPFLGGASLSPSQLDRLSTYLDLLVRWNARVNLTAVRDPEQIVTRHFGESLFAARALCGTGAPGSCGTGDLACESPAQRAIPPDQEPLAVHDLGSGAGFPGLPMKIWAPAARVTLIESQNKKQTFLREVIRALSLTGIDVFPGRAEDLTTRADLVTLRAVERFERALPVAASLLRPGGRLALLIGSAQTAAARNHARHLQWSEPFAIPLSEARILLVGTNPHDHVPQE